MSKINVNAVVHIPVTGDFIAVEPAEITVKAGDVLTLSLEPSVKTRFTVQSENGVLIVTAKGGPFEGPDVKVPPPGDENP
jgi:hypothetical protein